MLFSKRKMLHLRTMSNSFCRMSGGRSEVCEAATASRQADVPSSLGDVSAKAGYIYGNQECFFWDACFLEEGYHVGGVLNVGQD